VLDAGAAVALDPQPVLVQLGVRRAVLGGEHAPQPAREPALVDPLGDERPHARVQQQLLHGQRAVHVGVEPAVEEGDPLDLDREPALGAPGEQLLAHAHAVVVHDQRRPLDPVVAPERLGQVGLLVDRVVVRRRLVAVAEAEEVEHQQPPLGGELAGHRRPVPRARRKAVQQRGPRSVAGPLGAREQAVAAGVGPLAGREPGLDPVRHRTDVR
jgi:hypothetical protein